MDTSRTDSRNPSGRAHRRRVPPLHGALVLLLACASGCEFLKPDMKEVKRAIRGHSLALGRSDWKQAASYCDSGMGWQPHGRKLKGRAAIQGYINSIRKIPNLDAVYIEPEELIRLSETKIGAVTIVRCPQTVSSITMDYASLSWRAKFIWVKKGRAEWKIAGIQETERSKLGVPSAGGSKKSEGGSRRIAGEGSIIPEL